MISGRGVPEQQVHRCAATMDLAIVILVSLTRVICVSGDTVHQTMVTPTPYGAGLEGTTISCIRSNPDTDVTFTHRRHLELTFAGFVTSNFTFQSAGTYSGTSTLTWYLPASGIDSAGIFRCSGETRGLDTNVYSIIHGVDRKFESADGLVTKTVNIGENVTMSVQPVNGGTSPEWYQVISGQIVSSSLILHLTEVTMAYDGDVYVVRDPNAEFTYDHLGMFRLIVRGCKGSKWGPPDCTGICDMCYNGGVCDDETGDCICAPGFRGTNCLNACGKHTFGWYCEYECGPGNLIRSCTGTQFGLPDPYGNSCISGYTGRECDTECSSGTFGAGCTQSCNCLSGTCDAFTGVSTGLPSGCKDGWYGTNCQIPEMCPIGYYGEQCNHKCLCSNDTYCGRHDVDCDPAPPEDSLDIVLIAAIGGGVLVFIVVICISLTLLVKVRNHNGDQRRQGRHPTVTTDSERLRVIEEHGLQDYEHVGQDGESCSYEAAATGCPSMPYDNVDVGLPAWASQWGIPLKDMMFGEKVLGQGQFGAVLDGAVKVRGEIFKAAVKQLNARASEADRHTFLKEFRAMAEMPRHPNVVGILGACQADDGLYVALEYLPNGDLRSYLRNARSTWGHSQSSTSPKKLLKFAVDVANGMSHLAASKVIHGDLAARNILLDSFLVAKISDFGLSRGEDIYVTTSSKTRISTRWLAVESVTQNHYSSKSDVWSFGVVLWEIVTLGGTPYPDTETADVVHKLLSGYRLPKPSNCDQKMFELMSQCWQKNPKQRPSFNDLVSKLTRMADNPKQHISDTKDAVYVNICQDFDDN